MLSSLPCSYAFADLLSLHLVTFLMFFILVVILMDHALDYDARGITVLRLY